MLTSIVWIFISLAPEILHRKNKSEGRICGIKSRLGNIPTIGSQSKSFI